MRQRQSTRVNWGWRVGKGVVSQVSLDQSITKRQQTDKKVKRTENITAIALEWCFVSPTLFTNKHCQFLYSDFCGFLFSFFPSVMFFYVLMFVSAFISALDMHIYYIDTSVLLKNIPLVKFIKTTSGTRVVYFP